MIIVSYGVGGSINGRGGEMNDIPSYRTLF